MAAAMLTDHMVIQIRDEWDAGIINVREWANMLEVSPETIRKVGRRDTYRHLGKPGFQSADKRFAVNKTAEQFERPAAEIDESLKKLMQQLDDVPIGNAFE